MTNPEAPHEPAIPRPRFFFAVSLLAACFFVFWSWLVGGEDIPKFDRECAEYWRDWSDSHPSMHARMVYLTDLGGIAAMTVMAIMGAIWQTAIRHRFLAAAWLVIIVGAGILTVTTKDTFLRQRPPPELRDRAVFESNKSYPSGHSMTSVIGYGMLAYSLILPQRRRPRRVVTLTLITCLMLTIGFSRIYLRAHWFSDVIGGAAVGLTWLFFCIGWLELRRHRLKHRGVADASAGI